MQDTLAQVHEGMTVLDKAGHQIGKVDLVKFSDEDPDTPEPEQVAVNPVENGNRTLLDDLLEAFRIDQVPEEVHDHLLRQGFVRIDAEGLLASDRYITREQIDTVEEGRLTLKVGKDDLIRRR